jgi:hypothetical protein
MNAMTYSNVTPAIVAPAITPGLTDCAGFGEFGDVTAEDVGDDIGPESVGPAADVTVDDTRAEAVGVEALGDVR